MIQVTYQKNDGSIIQKIRKTMLPYEVGDTTSMGWKVLDIEYEYNDEYLPFHKYSTAIEKDKQKCLRKKEISESCVKEAKIFLYYFLTVMIINLLKTLFGV